MDENIISLKTTKKFPLDILPVSGIVGGMIIYPLVIVIETPFGEYPIYTRTHDPKIKDIILKSKGISYAIYSDCENRRFVWVSRKVPVKDIISIELKAPLEGDKAKECLGTFPSFGIVYDSCLKKAYTSKARDYSMAWRCLPVIGHIRRFLNPPYYNYKD